MYRLKGASAGVANQVFELQQRTLIGRADDCDLRLDDPGCAPRHCSLEIGSDGALTLTQDPGAAGLETQVNGHAVTTAVLSRGDEVRIGATRWVVQAPGLRPQRVLTGEAVRARRSRVPVLLVVALLAAAALAWQRGWLPF